jgi:hypothetical protein
VKGDSEGAIARWLKLVAGQWKRGEDEGSIRRRELNELEVN